MNKRIGLWLAAMLLAIAPSLVLAGGPKGGSMPEPPSHVGEYLWLMELSATPESPDVFDIRVFKIYYNQVTNRIVILGDDDGVREIPTLTNDGDRIPQTGAMLLLDSNGDLATSLAGATDPFVIDSGANPIGITWPQHSSGAATESKVLGINPSGASAFVKTSILVAEVSGVDLNVTTKTTLFTPGSSQTWVVDYVIVRDASTSLTTASFPFGSNANADDWKATAVHAELTTSTRFTKIQPMDGAEVTTNSTPFGIKPTIAQGAAATVTIEVYAHRVS